MITSILSTFLAQPTTLMPCWTSARATAAPMPTEAPVTRATLPFHRSISSVYTGSVRETTAAVLLLWLIGSQCQRRRYYCYVRYLQSEDAAVRASCLCSIQDSGGQCA